MGCIVYIKARNSARNAHQYVHREGQKIGELWREQVQRADRNGPAITKWRWFAEPAPCITGSTIASTPPPRNADHYDTKDKAVDFLEGLAAVRISEVCPSPE